MGLVSTRSYEDVLGDGIEALLNRKQSTAAQLAAGLNEMNIRARSGGTWTESNFVAEMQRLGAATYDDGPACHLGGDYPTQPFAAKAENAEAVLRIGLPNLWYLVARSSDVGDRPVGLKRLSRNLVLWRNAQGHLNVVEDYCPHRGAPLSLGQVIGDHISCPYHGIQINGDGEVAAVPPTPQCALLGKTFIQRYASREIGGAIFVYIGDASTAPEPVFPEEVTSPEWSSFLFMTVWNCNWQLALDNRLDPVHGSFLHEGTFTLGAGKKETELRVDPTPTGFQTYRTNQKGVNIDWNEVAYHPRNILWITTEIPYPPAFGGGSFRINGHPTPIDENSTLVWFYRSRKIGGWERDMWRFLYRNRLEARNLEVVDQDRILLERIPADARKRERLIQTDIAVARFRRELLAEAQAYVDGDASSSGGVGSIPAAASA